MVVGNVGNIPSNSVTKSCHHPSLVGVSQCPAFIGWFETTSEPKRPSKNGDNANNDNSDNNNNNKWPNALVPPTPLFCHRAGELLCAGCAGSCNTPCFCCGCVRWSRGDIGKS